MGLEPTTLCMAYLPAPRGMFKGVLPLNCHSALRVGTSPETLSAEILSAYCCLKRSAGAAVRVRPKARAKLARVSGRLD